MPPEGRQAGAFRRGLGGGGAGGGRSAARLCALPPQGAAQQLAFEPTALPITPDRQRRFVAALAATGIVGKAARSIGKSTEALYRLKHLPGAEGFSAAWDAAVKRGLQRIDDCAFEGTRSSGATRPAAGPR